MRISSIDALRVPAMLAVVLLHTDRLLPADTDGDLFTFFRTTWRFAVPFFFATSAYFVAAKLVKQNDVIGVAPKYIKRILFIYAIWTLIYFIQPTKWIMLLVRVDSPQGFYWNSFALLRQISDSFEPKIVIIGSMYHLWFLPALAIGLLVISLARHCRLEALLIPLASMLYLSCLFFDMPYMGNYTIAIASCVFGWRLATRPIGGISLAWWAIAGGLAVMLFEVYYLKHTIGVFAKTYGVGAVMLAAGLLMFAISRPTFMQNTILPKLGQYTLGIYATHALADQFLTMAPSIWDGEAGLLLFPITVYVCALALTGLLVRLPFTRSWVA